MNCKEKASKIKALVFDIDGVLTNGQIGYCGSEEVKFFDVKDGHGIKLAKRAGYIVGAISGRSGQANRKRAEELGLDFLYEGKKKKGEAFDAFLVEFNLKGEECLFIGDDVIDIPIFRKVGISVAVADAPPYVAELCDFTTKLPGGRGAVREVIDWILKENGQWDELMKIYFAVNIAKK